MILGKDGKPFDRDRYVSWGLNGKSSLNLTDLKRIRKVPLAKRWRCPKCQRCFAGMAIPKHRKEGCEPFQLLKKD